MTTKVLKSKINNLLVSRGTIFYDGSICLPKDLMESANLMEHEKVEVINIKNGNRETLFVRESEDVVVPFKLAAVGSIITVMSTVTVPIDEYHNQPLIVDLNH